MGGKHIRMCSRRHSERQMVRIHFHPPDGCAYRQTSYCKSGRQPVKGGPSLTRRGQYGTVPRRQEGRVRAPEIAGSNPACSSSPSWGSSTKMPLWAERRHATRQVRPICRCGVMAAHQLPRLAARVRIPSPAPRGVVTPACRSP